MMIALHDHPKISVPLTEARRRLAEPEAGHAAFRMVCAAALLAASACCLAMAVILGPFWQINDPQIISTPTPTPTPTLAAHQSRGPATPQISAIVPAPPPPKTSVQGRHWR